jgi:putative tryptophan/tyrosine transport system substrate-binding protein
MPVIGVLSPISAAAAKPVITAFRSALRDLGYIEGRNVALALRYGDGIPERMPPLARELVALNADVIVTGAQSGALAAHDATRTIPIVVVTPEDPVASGLAHSIARPGKNVTGTWTFGDDGFVSKRLEFLQLAVPGIARVGVLINPDDPTDTVQVPPLMAAAKPLGIAIHIFEVRDVAQFDEVAAQIVGADIKALFVGQGPTFYSNRAAIAATVIRLRMPAVYFFREFVEAGGLMSYGPNLPDLWRQSARLVGKILKGDSPANLPFELPTRYELIVNVKTAKTIGFPISDSFLLLADEVIE